MKNFLYGCLNNISIATIFITATIISMKGIIYGIIAYFIAFICLDLHSYIDKKLNYPNNLFIKH